MDLNLNTPIHFTKMILIHMCCVVNCKYSTMNVNASRRKQGFHLLQYLTLKISFAPLQKARNYYSLKFVK